VKLNEFIQPNNQIAAQYSSQILLKNITFAAIEAKLLGNIAKATLSYQVPQIFATWSKHEPAISTIFPFRLVVETKDQPGGLAEAIADISVVIHLEYKLVENTGSIPQEHLPHVLGTFGYMHAWPYFRADVQWLTTKLGFPALVLPVVLSGQVGDRVVIRRNPIGEDATQWIESSASKATSPALPAPSKGSTGASKKTQSSRKAQKN
jgi:hypothetical protein